MAASPNGRRIRDDSPDFTGRNPDVSREPGGFTAPGSDVIGARRVTPLGRYVVETLVMLLGVATLAVFVLVLGRRFGVGRAQGPLELVGRLPLDARRVVYLVRVGGRVLVLGGSEAGLQKLSEAGEDEIELPPPGAGPKTFREVLDELTARRRKTTPPSADSRGPSQ
jgi:flagellar protein FliO/FliZ